MSRPESNRPESDPPESNRPQFRPFWRKWQPTRHERWWPDEARDPTPWDLISGARRFNRFLQLRLDRAVDGLALSFAQYEVLELLYTSPNQHAGALARELRISRQAAASLVFQLERAGLIEPSSEEGGRRFFWLTREGRDRMAMARNSVNKLEDALAAVSADERRAMLESFRRCERALTPPARTWWID